MLEKLDSPEHLVAMRLSGGLTASDVEEAYRAIEEAIKTTDQISFFAEVDPSLHLTAQGLFKDAIEGLGSTRVVDLHLWQIGPRERSCIVSLITTVPRTLSEYRIAVLKVADVSHLTIEVETRETI